MAQINFSTEPRAGKVMISRQILLSEKRDKLSRFNENESDSQEKCKKNRNKNWYRILCHKILKDYRESEKLNIGIITFNYDVSLDYYLYSRICSGDILPPEKVAALLQNLSENIVHVYGQVRNYDWQQTDPQKIPYQTTDYKNIRHCEEIGEGLGIVGSRIADAAQNKIREWMKPDLKNLYFLGFGFDDQNIELLGLGSLFPNIELRRTENIAKPDVLRLFYTNYNNHEIINGKIKKIFPKDKLQDYRSVNDRKIIPHPSEKCVYRALTEDFPLL